MKKFAFILSFTMATPVPLLFAQTKNQTITAAAAAFEKLKSLAGEWQGPGPQGLITISYQIVSGGSAVMETLVPINEPSMVTLYHLDGGKLMMTHYCSIGNQPRMQAEPPRASEIKKLNFAFVAATNLAKPFAGHMAHLTFTFQDQDHFTQVWTWRQEGKDSPALFSLQRKK